MAAAPTRRDLALNENIRPISVCVEHVPHACEPTQGEGSLANSSGELVVEIEISTRPKTAFFKIFIQSNIYYVVFIYLSHGHVDINVQAQLGVVASGLILPNQVEDENGALRIEEE